MTTAIKSNQRIIVLFLLLTGWLAFSADLFSARAADPDPRVAEIRIRLTSAQDEELWAALARDLLPLKKGEPYTLAALEESVNALKETRLFEAIHVPDPVKTGDRIFLTFELTPFLRVKDIRINNAFPLFHREVLTVMNMEVGGPYDPKLLQDQAGRIEQLFRQQGFPGASVRVTAEPDPGDGHYVIEADIDQGPFQKIRRIRFEGNRAVSSSRLKLSSKSWRSTLLFGTAGRFVPGNLKKDIQVFTALFRKKGYADVQILARAVETGTANQVDVVFSINEGPLYSVSFQGNAAISDRTLAQEMTLEKDGNLNNFALNKDLRTIRQKYQEQGFAQARVQETGGREEAGPARPTSPDGAGPARRQINIRIEEGPQDKVARVTVTGNLHLSADEILDNVLTPEKGGIFSAKVLEEDARAVRALYLKKGFAHATVEKKVGIGTSDDGKTRWATVELAITEGVLTRVETVAFTGLSALPREAALDLLSLRPGRLYDPSLKDTDATALHQAISEAGYPHVRVSADTQFNRDGTAVRIIHRIEQGPKVKVGQIFYTGNLKTRVSVLSREMTLAPGDPFVLSKIVASRRNLLDLNALDSAGIRSVGLKTQEEEVDLLVEVSEKKPYFVELGTGYDTERHLYLTSGLGDRNFLGQNLNLQTLAELSQIGYKADLSLTDPRFLSRRISSQTRLFTERLEEFNKDFGTRTYGVSQDFLKLFMEKKLAVNLGLVYEFRDQYLTEARTLTADEVSEYTTRHIGTLTPGLTFRTTDSFIRPTKGMLATASADLSKGIDTDLDDFIKLKTDLRYYVPVFRSLTLALRGRYGIIMTYGNNTQFPDDQLFYLGGTSSVRGFAENKLRFDAQGDAVGGREEILGSAEARIDLGKNIEASLFYDIGAIRESTGTDESFRDSVGLGLRYLTPVGPIGFLYGWKLDPREGEGRGSFHFSMGYTF